VSYSDAKRKMAEVKEETPISHRCPANGCPNAAAVNLGQGWACYNHSRALPQTWSDVTRYVKENWPKTRNW
jgi:hypothetical protein